MCKIGWTLLAVATLSACATSPDARIERSPEAFAALSPEQQERVKQGSVGVGFDAAAVRLAIGEADRIVERETAEGQTQVWVYYAIVPGYYNNGYCGAGFPYFNNQYYCRPPVPTQYEERTRVVFQDGKVISIERSR